MLLGCKLVTITLVLLTAILWLAMSLIDVRPASLSWSFKDLSISFSLLISNSSIYFHLIAYSFSSKDSARDFCVYSCFSILTLLLPSFRSLPLLQTVIKACYFPELNIHAEVEHFKELSVSLTGEPNNTRTICRRRWIRQGRS